MRISDGSVSMICFCYVRYKRRICRFQGSRLPSWMMIFSSRGESLRKIVTRENYRLCLNT